MSPDSAHERRIAGRYRLTHAIGSGGSGTVWAALDEILGRQVAVKDVQAPAWLNERERQALRERTLREARALGRIGHPNVVLVYDVVEEDGRPWIVMQLVNARSLAHIIDEDGPLEPRQAAAIGLQVLEALQAAHEHGILHRDVKPSNVLVDDGGHTVLTDFGIATIDGEAALTAPDALVGAPSYIAPERVRGGSAQPASDLWSLGATLYTAVEGRPPYSRDGALPTLTAMLTDEPDPMSRAGALAPLLDRMLDRDPARRPSTAEAESALQHIALRPADSNTMPTTMIVPMLPGETTEDVVPEDVALGDVAPEDLVTEFMAAEGATSEGARSEGAAADDATSAVATPTRNPQRLHRRVVVAAAGLTMLAAVAAAFLLRPLPESGFPSRQPAGEPAVTVPITDGPARPSGAGAGAEPVQAPPDDPATQTTVQPVGDEPADDAAPSSARGPDDPTPTNTRAPTSTTTTTTEPTTTTTTTEQPTPSTGASSIAS